MKAIGFCDKLIHYLPEFLQKHKVLKDNVQLREISKDSWHEYLPPIVVSFDATKVNEHIEYLEKLSQVVGFADYMNDQFFEFKSKDDLLHQFEKRIVSDQLLVFLYQLPFPGIADTFLCLFPISKDSYNSQDVNFFASLVIQKLRDNNLLSKYNILLSDALACQATFVESLSNPENIASKPFDSDDTIFSSFQSLDNNIHISASIDQPHLCNNAWKKLRSEGFLFGNYLIDHGDFERVQMEHCEFVVSPCVFRTKDTMNQNMRKSIFSQRMRVLLLQKSGLLFIVFAGMFLNKYAIMKVFLLFGR